MPKLLSDKTVLVTGSANGIGQEMARTFALEGARIISFDLDEAENRQTAVLIQSAGGSCESIQGDVSVASDVERAFRAAGHVDILLNNAAAWSGDGFLHEIAEQDWERILAVSLKSVFLCCRLALPGMVKRQSGVIINISSVNALTGVALAAYTAAKGGVISITRVLAQQYGSHGVRVNAICPGTIMTQSSRRFYDQHPPQYEEDLRILYPAGKFGTPADVAECALFLSSERAKFINGSVVVVDGACSAVHRVPWLCFTTTEEHK